MLFRSRKGPNQTPQRPNATSGGIDPSSNRQWLLNQGQPLVGQGMALGPLGEPLAGPLHTNPSQFYTQVPAAGSYTPPLSPFSQPFVASDSSEEPETPKKKNSGGVAVRIIATVLLLILPCPIAGGALVLFLFNDYKIGRAHV